MRPRHVNIREVPAGGAEKKAPPTEQRGTGGSNRFM
jgi:hypothetical protein